MLDDEMSEMGDYGAILDLCLRGGQFSIFRGNTKAFPGHTKTLCGQIGTRLDTNSRLTYD